MNLSVKLGWLAFALVLAIGGLALSAPSALAAPPSNDTAAGATAASIGVSEVLDTTEATTDADDAQLNTECGAPATDASVWYTIVGADNGVLIDVSASDYTAGVLVGVGSPGSLSAVACAPFFAAFFAEAGTTYYVIAIDDQADGGGNGGMLSISFTEIPPPPSLDVTVNRSGRVNAQTGVATISGTYTCSDGDFIEVFVAAEQHFGRSHSVSGFGGFFDVGTCDGEAHNWSIEVVPDSGKFSGGRTMTVAFAFSCNLFQCADGFAEQVVVLRSGNK